MKIIRKLHCFNMHVTDANSSDLDLKVTWGYNFLLGILAFSVNITSKFLFSQKLCKIPE